MKAPMTATITARPDRTSQGIALILASVLVMAFADAIVKLFSADLTVWQIFVARSLFAMPCLVGLALTSGVVLRPRAGRWVLARSALLVCAWLSLYASYPVLSLSVAAVAVYTNPIMTALLSAAVLGERVTARQWFGVLLGFVGISVILKPGSDAFSWFVALPLLGAAFYSAAMILTRSKCHDEEPVTLALALHGAFIVTGAIATGLLAMLALETDIQAAFPFLIGGWAPMGPQDWAVMAVLGVLSAGFFMGVARAYQIAAPQIIATFDYGYLIFATLWGFVFFAEQPDAWTIFGMILVTGAGLLVAAPPK
jgi:drug/metabolite transporter (DMT)-like permease